jgi:RNA polymerase sigma-70 factor (ECF subfamily)
MQLVGHKGALMELVQKAKAGDSTAFDQLMGPLRSGIRDYLYRRLRNWDQAEDLCQEVLLSAFTHLGELQSDKEVKTWLFSLAHHLSDARVKEQATWSPDAVGILEENLLGNAGAQKDLQEIFLNNEEEFDPGYHVEFCFTVTSQSLLQQEKAAFLLREFADLNWQEIANIVGKDPSKVQEEWGDAWENLKQVFSGKCSLVNKSGECTQCRDFGEWLEGVEKTRERLKNFPLQISEKPGETFATRLEMVQELSLVQSPVKKFHKALLGLLRKVIGEKE